MGVIANLGFFLRLRKAFLITLLGLLLGFQFALVLKKRLLSREWHQLLKGIQRKYGIISSVAFLFPRTHYAIFVAKCVRNFS